MFHEKHGNRNVIAETSEGFFDLFLEVLKDRIESHYFTEPDEPQKPSITEDTVKSLPEGPTKKAAQQELNSYKRSLVCYKEEKLEWDTANKAINEKNGRLAYSILKNRSDKGAEYEGITVEQPEIV